MNSVKSSYATVRGKMFLARSHDAGFRPNWHVDKARICSHGLATASGTGLRLQPGTAGRTRAFCIVELKKPEVFLCLMHLLIRAV